MAAVDMPCTATALTVLHSAYCQKEPPTVLRTVVRAPTTMLRYRAKRRPKRSHRAPKVKPPTARPRKYMELTRVDYGRVVGERGGEGDGVGLVSVGGGIWRKLQGG